MVESAGEGKVRGAGGKANHSIARPMYTRTSYAQMQTAEWTLNSSIYLFLFLFPHFSEFYSVFSSWSRGYVRLPSTKLSLCCYRIFSLVICRMHKTLRFNSENWGVMQISTCLSSYFKILFHCVASLLFSLFFFVSHSLIPIEPFFACCLLSPFLFSLVFCCVYRYSRTAEHRCLLFSFGYLQFC